MAYIELNRRHEDNMFTIIDLEDLDKLKTCEYTWHAAYNKNAHGFYVITNIYGKNENGSDLHTTKCLHTYLANPDNIPNIVVDHKNHDMLDNRRCNLRATENSLNLTNRNGRNRNNKSGYRNVFWNTQAGKWQVVLRPKGKLLNFGFYDNVDKAGLVAEKARQDIYGEYAGKN